MAGSLSFFLSASPICSLGIAVFSYYHSFRLKGILVCSFQTLEMLEKKENVLLKKAATEVEKAKDYTRAKNKRGMTYKKC